MANVLLFGMAEAAHGENYYVSWANLLLKCAGCVYGTLPALQPLTVPPAKDEITINIYAPKTQPEK